VVGAQLAAVVERVRRLWSDGEKALVFCFYVQTGRALRSHISRALRHEIVSRAAARRSYSLDQAVLEFEPSGKAAAEFLAVYRYTCSYGSKGTREHEKEAHYA
jgi:hypothetical protein